jgi:sulfur carrier protein
MMINISLNNETISIPPTTRLSDALLVWGYENGKVAVAINGNFISRSAYAATELQEDDQIDIVKPVGGG